MDGTSTLREKRQETEGTVYIFINIFYHHPPSPTPKKSVIQLQKFFFIIMYTGKFEKTLFLRRICLTCTSQSG